MESENSEDLECRAPGDLHFEKEARADTAGSTMDDSKATTFFTRQSGSHKVSRLTVDAGSYQNNGGVVFYLIDSLSRGVAY